MSDASRYYSVLHPERFGTEWAEFYRLADARTASARQELPHVLDLAYGENEKQRLDLYLPIVRPQQAPVFLFLHGGGFFEGDRAHYGFIATPLAAHGIVTAVASYRLTPGGFHYPDQRRDAELAYAWLYRNIRGYGGDNGRLFAGGHSAGAILAAEIGVDRGWMHDAEIPARSFQGIVPISGQFDLRTASPDAEKYIYWSAYTPTAQQRADASPLLRMADPVPAALVAVGSLEVSAPHVDFVTSSRCLATALLKIGCNAQLMVLDSQGHRDAVMQLGESESELARALIRFIGSR